MPHAARGVLFHTRDATAGIRNKPGTWTPCPKTQRVANSRDERAGLLPSGRLACSPNCAPSPPHPTAAGPSFQLARGGVGPASQTNPTSATPPGYCLSISPTGLLCLHSLSCCIQGPHTHTPGPSLGTAQRAHWRRPCRSPPRDAFWIALPEDDLTDRQILPTRARPGREPSSKVSQCNGVPKDNVLYIKGHQ